ncbi:MAG: hypothetical protein ACK4GW_15625 [Pseudorhodobacter sp.]
MHSDPVHNPTCGAGRVVFLAGTRIATPLGWRTVERLRPGDRLLAASGAVGISGMCRSDSDARTCQQGIEVPPDCLGNREVAYLLPDHALTAPGGGARSIRAGDLPGYFGISHCALPVGAVLVTLDLERPAELCIAHGLWVRTIGMPQDQAGDMPSLRALLLLCAERVGQGLREAARPPPTCWPGAG